MPAYPEQHFRWTWEFVSPPAALWPLVSNTDRFNRDCGYPSVTVVAQPNSDRQPVTNIRRLRASVMGLVIEWDELAFEWIAPRKFGVDRTYYSGPVARMVMFCELLPNAAGGTTLVYDMRLTPSGLFGRLALPFSIGQQARATTERVFRRYDEFARRGLHTSALAQKPKLAAGSADRLAAISRTLVQDAGQPAPLVARLQEFIQSADDLAVARVRPYALADDWGADRRQTLHLFLHATRAGLLDFSWDLVCPHCRGAKASQSSLARLKPQAHCDACNADFTVNFDQLLELTFVPNASVRAVVRPNYCVGGPQVTPHIVAQQLLAPGANHDLPLALKPGSYRARSPGLLEQHAFRVEPAGPDRGRIDLGAPPLFGLAIAPTGLLTLANQTDAAHLAIVEHLAWSDQATTAAEVTSLQLFRDLFSREVLRLGENISVGSITVVFTDLKNSTQLYQEIGDAPAFGRVLTHFEILKAAVAAEDGAIVKTMGDAIMAVFARPVSAIRAMRQAQRHLAQPQEFPRPDGLPSNLQPLALKAGIHCGPCLAINQNDRLDYFGTTVNLAARLCGLCHGPGIVLSSAVHADGEVAALLAAPNNSLTCTADCVTVRGFGAAVFEIWRTG